MESKSIKILLAEDSLVVQRIIVHTLEKENYSVVCLSTGENVIETVKSLNPSIIILLFLMLLVTER